MYNFQPKTLFIGKKTNYLPSCHSTNSIALQMIQNKEASEGTIVITDNQFAGRGQRGNSWEALPGQNITLSVLLKPSFLLPMHQFGLNMAVSLAIQDFLEKMEVKEASIKWPNDVYIENKKMGGVLIENLLAGNSIGFSVVGIGLNINQVSFENQKAISLKMATGKSEFDKILLVESLCESLEKFYFLLKNKGKEALISSYEEHLFRKNEWHFFQEKEATFEGKILGVSEYGELRIESKNQGVRQFDFKEISFLNLG